MSDIRFNNGKIFQQEQVNNVKDEEKKEEQNLEQEQQEEETVEPGSIGVNNREGSFGALDAAAALAKTSIVGKAASSIPTTSTSASSNYVVSGMKFDVSVDDKTGSFTYKIEGNKIIFTAHSCTIDINEVENQELEIEIFGANVILNSNAKVKSITNNASKSTINGSDEDDVIIDRSMNSTINAGKGDDTISASGLNTTIHADDGKNTITSSGVYAQIHADEEQSNISDTGVNSATASKTESIQAKRPEVLEDVEETEENAKNVPASEEADADNSPEPVKSEQVAPQITSLDEKTKKYTIDGISFTVALLNDGADFSYELKDGKVVFTGHSCSIDIDEVTNPNLDVETFGSNITLNSNQKVHSITNNASKSVINGSDDADVIIDNSNGSRINAGKGDDDITSTGLKSTVYAGEGDDTINVSGAYAEVHGEDGKDVAIVTGMKSTLDLGDQTPAAGLPKLDENGFDENGNLYDLETGKLFNGFAKDGKLYEDGVLFYGVADDGLLYEEGVLFSGFDNEGKLYVDGDTFSGLTDDGKLYIDGQIAVDKQVFEGKLYNNGELDTQTQVFDGKLYADGALAKGLLEFEELFYSDGVLANGEIDGVKYENGVKVADVPGGDGSATADFDDCKKVLSKIGKDIADANLLSDVKRDEAGRIISFKLDAAKPKEGEPELAVIYMGKKVTSYTVEYNESGTVGKITEAPYETGVVGAASNTTTYFLNDNEIWQGQVYHSDNPSLGPSSFENIYASDANNTPIYSLNIISKSNWLPAVTDFDLTSAEVKFDGGNIVTIVKGDTAESTESGGLKVTHADGSVTVYDVNGNEVKESPIKPGELGSKEYLAKAIFGEKDGFDDEQWVVSYDDFGRVLELTWSGATIGGESLAYNVQYNDDGSIKVTKPGHIETKTEEFDIDKDGNKVAHRIFNPVGIEDIHYEETVYDTEGNVVSVKNYTPAGELVNGVFGGVTYVDGVKQDVTVLTPEKIGSIEYFRNVLGLDDNWQVDKTDEQGRALTLKYVLPENTILSTGIWQPSYDISYNDEEGTCSVTKTQGFDFDPDKKEITLMKFGADGTAMTPDDAYVETAKGFLDSISTHYGIKRFAEFISKIVKDENGVVIGFGTTTPAVIFQPYQNPDIVGPQPFSIPASETMYTIKRDEAGNVTSIQTPIDNTKYTDVDYTSSELKLPKESYIVKGTTDYCFDEKGNYTGRVDQGVSALRIKSQYATSNYIVVAKDANDIETYSLNATFDSRYFKGFDKVTPDSMVINFESASVVINKGDVVRANANYGLGMDVVHADGSVTVYDAKGIAVDLPVIPRSDFDDCNSILAKISTGIIDESMLSNVVRDESGRITGFTITPQYKKSENTVDGLAVDVIRLGYEEINYSVLYNDNGTVNCIKKTPVKVGIIGSSTTTTEYHFDNAERRIGQIITTTNASLGPNCPVSIRTEDPNNTPIYEINIHVRENGYPYVSEHGLTSAVVQFENGNTIPVEKGDAVQSTSTGGVTLSRADGTIIIYDKYGNIDNQIGSLDWLKNAIYDAIKDDTENPIDVIFSNVKTENDEQGRVTRIYPDAINSTYHYDISYVTDGSVIVSEVGIDGLTGTIFNFKSDGSLSSKKVNSYYTNDVIASTVTTNYRDSGEVASVSTEEFSSDGKKTSLTVENYNEDGSIYIKERTSFDKNGQLTENVYNVYNEDGSYYSRVKSDYVNGEEYKDVIVAYDANNKEVYSVEDYMPGSVEPFVYSWGQEDAQISYNGNIVTVKAGDKATINKEGVIEVVHADGTSDIYNGDAVGKVDTVSISDLFSILGGKYGQASELLKISDMGSNAAGGYYGKDNQYLISKEDLLQAFNTYSADSIEGQMVRCFYDENGLTPLFKSLASIGHAWGGSSNDYLDFGEIVDGLGINRANVDNETISLQVLQKRLEELKPVDSGSDFDDCNGILAKINKGILSKNMITGVERDENGRVISFTLDPIKPKEGEPELTVIYMGKRVTRYTVVYDPSNGTIAEINETSYTQGIVGEASKTTFYILDENEVWQGQIHRTNNASLGPSSFDILNSEDANNTPIYSLSILNKVDWFPSVVSFDLTSAQVEFKGGNTVTITKGDKAESTEGGGLQVTHADGSVTVYDVNGKIVGDSAHIDELKAQYLEYQTKLYDLKMQKLAEMDEIISIVQEYNDGMNNKVIRIAEHQLTTDGYVRFVYQEATFENILKQGYMIIGTDGSAIFPSPYISKTVSADYHNLSQYAQEHHISADAYDNLSSSNKVAYRFADGEYVLKDKITDIEYKNITNATIKSYFETQITQECTIEWEYNSKYDNSINSKDLQTLLVSGQAQIVTKEFFDYMVNHGGYSYDAGLSESTRNFATLISEWDADDSKYNKDHVPSIIDWKNDDTSTFKEAPYTEDDADVLAHYEARSNENSNHITEIDIQIRNLETQLAGISNQLSQNGVNVSDFENTQKKQEYIDSLNAMYAKYQAELNYLQEQTAYANDEMVQAEAKLNEGLTNTAVRIQVNKLTEDGLTATWQELTFENLLKNGDYMVIGTNGGTINPSPYLFKVVSTDYHNLSQYAKDHHISADSYNCLSQANKAVYQLVAVEEVKDVNGDVIVPAGFEYALKNKITDTEYKNITDATIKSYFETQATQEHTIEWEYNSKYDNSINSKDLQTLLVSGQAQIVTKEFFDYMVNHGGYSYDSGLSESNRNFLSLVDDWESGDSKYNPEHIASVIDWNNDDSSIFKKSLYTEDDAMAMAIYEARSAEISANLIQLEGQINNAKSTLTYIRSELDKYYTEITEPTMEFGSFEYFKSVLGEEFSNNAFNSFHYDAEGRLSELVPYDSTSPKFRGDGKTYSFTYEGENVVTVTSKNPDGANEITKIERKYNDDGSYYEIIERDLNGYTAQSETIVLYDNSGNKKFTIEDRLPGNDLPRVYVFGETEKHNCLIALANGDDLRVTEGDNVVINADKTIQVTKSDGSIIIYDANGVKITDPVLPVSDFDDCNAILKQIGTMIPSEKMLANVMRDKDGRVISFQVSDLVAKPIYAVDAGGKEQFAKYVELKIFDTYTVEYSDNGNISKVQKDSGLPADEFGATNKTNYLFYEDGTLAGQIDLKQNKYGVIAAKSTKVGGAVNYDIDLSACGTEYPIIGSYNGADAEIKFVSGTKITVQWGDKVVGEKGGGVIVTHNDASVTVYDVNGVEITEPVIPVMGMGSIEYFRNILGLTENWQVDKTDEKGRALTLKYVPADDEPVATDLPVLSYQFSYNDEEGTCSVKQMWAAAFSPETRKEITLMKFDADGAPLTPDDAYVETAYDLMDKAGLPTPRMTGGVIKPFITKIVKDQDGSVIGFATTTPGIVFSPQLPPEGKKPILGIDIPTTETMYNIRRNLEPKETILVTDYKAPDVSIDKSESLKTGKIHYCFDENDNYTGKTEFGSTGLAVNMPNTTIQQFAKGTDAKGNVTYSMEAIFDSRYLDGIVAMRPDSMVIKFNNGNEIVVKDGDTVSGIQEITVTHTDGTKTFYNAEGVEITEPVIPVTGMGSIEFLRNILNLDENWQVDKTDEQGRALTLKYVLPEGSMKSAGIWQPSYDISYNDEENTCSVTKTQCFDFDPDKKEITLMKFNGDGELLSARIFDKDGYDENGYDIDGWNKKGWNVEGLNKETGTKYDKQGYDIAGWNEKGWNVGGLNKETGTKYDKEGYDINGINAKNYDRQNRFYVNGTLANGPVNGTLYKGGFVDTSTQVYQNVLYVNGKKATGEVTFNNLLYINGTLANGSYGDKDYASANLLKGTVTYKEYKNGVLVKSVEASAQKSGDIYTISVKQMNNGVTKEYIGTLDKELGGAPYNLAGGSFGLGTLSVSALDSCRNVSLTITNKDGSKENRTKQFNGYVTTGELGAGGGTLHKSPSYKYTYSKYDANNRIIADGTYTVNEIPPYDPGTHWEGTYTKYTYSITGKVTKQESSGWLRTHGIGYPREDKAFGYGTEIMGDLTNGLIFTKMFSFI